MNTNMKARLLSKEPLDNKPVTELPGVGPTYGKKLADHGYREIMDVYRKYQTLNKNKFQNWMKNTCGARLPQAGDCYDFFVLWESEFGENTNPKKNAAPVESKRKCNIKESAHVKNNDAPKPKIPRVVFQESRVEEAPTEDAPETVEQQEDNQPTLRVEKCDPMTSFFLSTLATVQTFPRKVQLKMKKEIFLLVSNAENELVDQEPEPVVPTSTRGPTRLCAARKRSSTSLEELLNNLDGS